MYVYKYLSIFIFSYIHVYSFIYLNHFFTLHLYLHAHVCICIHRMCTCIERPGQATGRRTAPSSEHSWGLPGLAESTARFAVNTSDHPLPIRRGHRAQPFIHATSLNRDNQQDVKKNEVIPNLQTYGGQVWNCYQPDPNNTGVLVDSFPVHFFHSALRRIYQRASDPSTQYIAPHLRVMVKGKRGFRAFHKYIQYKR